MSSPQPISIVVVKQEAEDEVKVEVKGELLDTSKFHSLSGYFILLCCIG